MNKSTIALLSILFVACVFFVAAQTNVVNLQDFVKVEIVSPVKDGWVKVVNMDKEHFEMHEGDHYFIKTWLENTGASETADYFAFTTPSTTTRIHAKTVLFADTDTIFNIYENCTISGGTPVPGINNDRDSTNVAELTPVAAPTILTTGYIIFSGRNGGGRNPVGVSLSGNYEIIAKTNTSYCFEIEKQTSADTVVDVDFFWYEEDEPHE